MFWQVQYWTFHDRDIAPLGQDLEETNRNLDELTDLALQLQQETGVKLLWATSNLFAHPCYASGASTNPQAHVFAMAAAQVKKGMEVAKKLGAEGFGMLCMIYAFLGLIGLVSNCSTLSAIAFSVLGRPGRLSKFAQY